MSKLEDYDFGKQIPEDVSDFKDAVREIVNFGKYQFQLINATTAPTFAGREVEVTFVRNGTDGRMYVYMGTSWNLALLFTADAA